MEQVQPSIDQMNEIIALFMGYEKYEDKYGIWFKIEGLIKCLHPKLQDLNFHRSWDLLMPVWVKFRNLVNDNKHVLESNRRLDSLSWYLYCANEPKTFHERMYYAIQWYNSQQKLPI